MTLHCCTSYVLHARLTLCYIVTASYYRTERGNSLGIGERHLCRAIFAIARSVTTITKDCEFDSPSSHESTKDTILLYER